MKKDEFKIIEVFNENGRNVEDVLLDIFKSYIKQKINSENDLNIKK